MNTFSPTEGNEEIFKRWQKAGVYNANETDANKRYVLNMFPYPSGEGLHVGHVEGWVGSDILARYFRSKGYNVLYPIGWDAFGLPAENFAIKKGVHPRKTTNDNIARFSEQIKALGISCDWSREINTSDPLYYKWTQWLFVQLYKEGLAYRALAKVNWCNSCQTVLANEQVIAGRCERCDSVVVQKKLKQWFFKITEYAERLLTDTKNLDWPEHIKAMQRNWIGRSQGAEIDFTIADTDKKITVFTTRPDTLNGATYIVLAPEHPLVALCTKEEQKKAVEVYCEETAQKTNLQRTDFAKEKTGVFTGSYALHPVSKKKLPIWVADYVIMDYGGGAIMAVPAGDTRDMEFAQKFTLPIEQITPLDVSVGREKVTYRLRDWLISRQRYWGAPIPIIYCEKCGIVPVEEKDLPVTLPDDVDFLPTGESPLAKSQSFHNVVCPKCLGKARRESDTMDTFICSSWYFLRYCDPHNNDEAFAKDKVSRFMPVDVYIGGVEHAVMHLLYARFITKFLFDKKHIKFEEPFLKLRNQGVILGPDNQKMSKSRGNIISPDEIIESYGPDVLRMYEMFIGPFEQPKPWNTGGLEGIFRFVKKVLKLYKNASPSQEKSCLNETKVLVKKCEKKILALDFNTIISDFMTYVNNLPSLPYSLNDLKVFAIVYSFFAPFSAEEIWQNLGEKTLIVSEAWPEIGEPEREEKKKIVVQINGKTRGQISILYNDPKETIISKIAKEPQFVPHIKNVKIEKVFYVPKRLINFVTKQD